jgi:hypothetical protein
VAQLGARLIHRIVNRRFHTFRTTLLGQRTQHVAVGSLRERFREMLAEAGAMEEAFAEQANVGAGVVLDRAAAQRATRWKLVFTTIS